MDYYSVSEIETLDELKKYFPNGEANELNFVLFSTSGVHGFYTTIEDIEKEEDDEVDSDCDNHRITILYIQPRTVRVMYGHIEVTKDDLEYLKKLRKTSLDAISNIGFYDIKE